MTVCRRVHYWGKVQGVGFRYTAQRVAQGFQVAGYVRNLLDGQVELVAEGAEAEVQQFLNALAVQMADFIKGQSVQDEAPQGFGDFQIKA